MSADELFDIIDDATGEVIGTAPRKRCHGDPSLIHRSVHIVVFNTAGQILLQKRNLHKDIQPGKWDTAVGGHLDSGETYLDAAKREFGEELGIPLPGELKELFAYKIRNEIESENVQVFTIVCDGPFQPQESEIDQVAFFDPADLKARLLKGDTVDMTPVLCRELNMLLQPEN